MPKIILLLAVIICTGVFAIWDMVSAPTQQSTVTFERPSAPNFSVKDLNGAEHQLKDLQGKTVLINFWATWCTPCVKEMPQLFQLAEREKDTLIFLPISVDRTPEIVTEFFQRMNLNTDQENIILGYDPKMTISPLYETNMFPESFIIDPSGRIKHKVIGITEWLDDDMKHILNKE